MYKLNETYCLIFHFKPVPAQWMAFKGEDVGKFLH